MTALLLPATFTRGSDPRLRFCRPRPVSVWHSCNVQALTVESNSQMDASVLPTGLRVGGLHDVAGR